MGNVATKLSEIAKANCAVTYSFGNGRDFPQTIVPSVGPLAAPVRQPRKKLVQAAFNDDLTDCVEVYTPFSALGHLGNGQGLFRHFRYARSLFQVFLSTE